MLNSPLHGVASDGCRAVAARIQHLHAHQRGIRCHACLLARSAIAAHRSGAVRAVAVVVHGVVVVVAEIETVVGIFHAAVPKVVGKVQVIVVHARVDDRHHHALTRVAQIPNLVGVHLGDVGGDSTGVARRSGLFTEQGIFLFIQTDEGNVPTHGQVVDGLLGS